MLAHQEAAARIAARRGLVANQEIPWQEAAFALQRKSARKRALESAIDAAAQDIAAHRDEIERFVEEGANEDDLKSMRERRENRRARIARAAVREYNRRLEEIGRLKSSDK